MGPAGTGRGLGKCPPAPAVGRHLLLYFAQTPARPDEARRAVRKAQHARPPFKEAPTNSERRADALAYEVKGEVTANGRRRRTFVRKGIRPAPRRMNPPHACLRPDSPRTDGPRRDRQGPGQMSPGAGRWPSPSPLLCPNPCPPRRGSACGEESAARAAAFQGSADKLRTPGGCPCVRSKGGGDGQRPAPEDIRTQGHPPGATQNESATRVSSSRFPAN